MLERSIESFNILIDDSSIFGDSFVIHQESCACAECTAGTGNSDGGEVVAFAPDLVPGSIATTATLSIGSSVDVSIDTLGDRDWYRVTLTAGTTYTIQTSSDGSGTDAFLNLRDATGNIILTSDDDSGDGVNSLITFTAVSSGTYYVDAGTYANQTTGSYHLFIAPTLAAGDSVLGTTATTTALAIGGTFDGNIDSSGDHDFYAVNLLAGQTYIFRTAGTAATDVTDTILTLRNAAGAQLLVNDDAGEAGFSAIRYTATTTGTYYLDVSAFGATTGAFNVSAFTAPTPVVYTNDQIALQLTNGYWGGASHRFGVTTGGTLTFNVVALTAEGQTLARAALALWSDVTGITFSEVAIGGQLIYDDNQVGAFATATHSGGITSVANINVGTAWITTYGTGLNTYSFQTYIHETGHALGLGHGGNYNGAADYASDSLYLNDSWATTIMSYFDQQENTYFQALGFTRQFAETPMVADGIAVSNLYGVATTTRVGDTTYGFNNTSGRDIYNAALYPALSYTIFDNGGIDTLDYSGFSANQQINLNAETFSNVGTRVGNVSIARGTVIENAIGGSGNDLIIGNSADNRLTGNGGADSLSGGDGNDTLFADMLDTVISGGSGTDKVVFATSGVVIAALSGLEAIELVGGANVTLTGTQFATGLATNSALSGSGTITVNMNVGVNFLGSAMSFAGTGVGIIVNGTSGIDIIKLGLSNAGSNTVNGGDGVDQIRGSQFADTINGDGGNDKIMSLGGADVLTGGAGNDQFRYFAATDSGLGANRDRITDFTVGGDRLNFALIDADAATAGDQAFSFIGTGAFAATGIGQIRYGTSGADILVQADVNGDGIVDMEIILQGIGGQTLTGPILFCSG
jgi:serralysin